MALPQAPSCVTDYLWWMVTILVGVLGYVLSFVIKKGVIGRLDDQAVSFKNFLDDFSKFKVDILKEFVNREEFGRLLSERKDAHTVVNGRLNSLDIQQNRIEAKLDTFHGDMSNKMNRLSKTFILRDTVISMRLDNLCHKAGVDPWTKAQEEEIVKELQTRLNGEENGSLNGKKTS